MKRLLLGIAFLFSLLPLLTQCDVSHKSPGEQAQIPTSAQTITFSGVNSSDVVFQHEQHSERYKGMCIKCHDHQPIAGQTHWYCRSCHTAGQDREKLCTAVKDHGCIMTQCDTCHKAQVPPQAPPLAKDCAACHILVPGPSPGTPIYTKTDSIASKQEVDHWTLPLKTSGTIIIDVQAYEACGPSGKWKGTDYFRDGADNNRLVANIYLFKKDGTLVSSTNGQYPGELRLTPTPHIETSAKNPYLSVPVSAGTYILAIGSYPLSQIDAWNGVNTSGTSWKDYDDANKITLYNWYTINIYSQNP